MESDKICYIIELKQQLHDINNELTELQEKSNKLQDMLMNQLLITVLLFIILINLL